MNLKFEIENGILKYKKPHNNIHTDSDGLFASFVFTTPDWKHIEKYAIFWNKKGQSFIRFLGRGVKERCPIPQEILGELYFFVQVYANDNIKTQKLKVFVYDEVSTHHTNDKKCDKKFLHRFFEEMEGKIDNIIYDDNRLLIYANNTLVKTINIVDEKLLTKIVTGSAPKFIIDQALSEESEHPVANKTIYEALQEKVNIDTLSAVAFSGDYNDLINKPTELPMEPHTHESSDINNWDDSIEEDFDTFIDDLIEKL